MNDNELIAEFMGMNYYNDYGHHGDTYYEEAVIDPEDPDFVQSPHWHESWDWLMPVVEKIESMAPNRVVIDCNECRIISDRRFKVHTLKKINSVYQCVVQFIKWYNSCK